jgi:hypothetical protein
VGELETRLRLARNGDSRAETRNPLSWLGELHDPVSQAEVGLFIGGDRAFWAGREIFKTILGGNDVGWREVVGSFGVTRDFVAV